MNKGANLYVGAYYRPHIYDQYSVDQLDLSLQKLYGLSSNPKIWLAGDFNAPYIDWDTMSVLANRPYAAIHTSLIDLIQDHSLVQVVTQPTRFQNILDLFLLNYPNELHNLYIMPGISDHNIVCADLCIKLKILKQVPREIYLYHKANWDMIRQNMIRLFLNDETGTAEQLWTKFRDTAIHGMNQYIPRKISRKRNGLPWITPTIRRQIRKRNKLYQQYKTFRSDEIHHKFIILKHSIQKQIRLSYRLYINDLITPPSESDHNHSTTNLKKFWTFIKSLKKDSCSIQSLKLNDLVVTDGIDKAEVLNSYFQSVFTHELDTELPDKGPSPYPSMSNIDITTQGTAKLLNGLNIHKASGPDLISTRFLKETADVIAPLLQVIFKASLNTGEVPSDWRIANISPIFKKGDRCLPQNYQPISLTSTVSKIFEHIISSHIMEHLEHNHILYELQYGFRRNRSCESQLISLINDLTKSYDAGQQSDVICMDIAKAFDTVPHNRLKLKLQ